MALFSALCAFLATPEGFTNRLLREQIGRRYDSGARGYTAARMSYDLRRLRLKGLVHRVAKTHRYVLTPQGRRIAFFMTKSYCRLVRPLLHRADTRAPPDASDRIQRTWANCEAAIDAAIRDANIAA